MMLPPRHPRVIARVTCSQLILVSLPVLHIKWSLACEQAPGGASAEQTFGAKRRAIGACTHSPKSPLPPTRRLTC